MTALTPTERQIAHQVILDRWNPHRLAWKLANHHRLKPSAVEQLLKMKPLGVVHRTRRSACLSAPLRRPWSPRTARCPAPDAADVRGYGNPEREPTIYFKDWLGDTATCARRAGKLQCVR